LKRQNVEWVLRHYRVFWVIRQGGLQRLIEPPDALASELWLLSHPDLRRTARVRALMGFLSEAIDAERTLIEGCGVVSGGD